MHKIHIQTFNHPNHIIGTPNRSKTTKIALQCSCRLAIYPLPLGGSWRKPKKWVQTYVSPGDSRTTARRFLEKSRNTNITRESRFHSFIMVQIIHSYHCEIKQAMRTSLTWISLLNLLKVLLPSCLPISFLLFYQFRPRTSSNTHKYSPFVLYFRYSLNLAKTFPNTQLLPFKSCLNLGQ